MDISLPTEQENYIKGKVKAGTYHCESDVVRDALRLMADQDAMRESKLDALRKEINKGLDSLDRGEGMPLDIKAIKARGQAMLKGDS